MKINKQQKMIIGIVLVVVALFFLVNNFKTLSLFDTTLGFSEDLIAGNLQAKVQSDSPINQGFIVESINSVKNHSASISQNSMSLFMNLESKYETAEVKPGGTMESLLITKNLKIDISKLEEISFDYNLETNSDSVPWDTGSPQPLFRTQIALTNSKRDVYLININKDRNHQVIGSGGQITTTKESSNYISTGTLIIKKQGGLFSLSGGKIAENDVDKDDIIEFNGNIDIPSDETYELVLRGYFVVDGSTNLPKTSLTMKLTNLNILNTNTTTNGTTNGTGEITVYRFQNNACSSISILPSARTSNDYDTLTECNSKIIGGNGGGNQSTNTTLSCFRVVNNTCVSKSYVINSTFNSCPVKEYKNVTSCNSDNKLCSINSDCPTTFAITKEIQCVDNKCIEVEIGGGFFGINPLWIYAGLGILGLGAVSYYLVKRPRFRKR